MQEFELKRTTASVLPHDQASANWKTLDIPIPPQADLLRRSLLRMIVRGISMSHGTRETEIEAFERLLGKLERTVLDFDEMSFRGATFHINRLSERIEKLLKPFMDNPLWKLPQDRQPLVKDLMDQLMEDITIFQLLEQGGLARVNQSLSQALTDLKELPNEQKQKAIDRLNNLLYRALYLFPDQARGVRLTLHLDDARATAIFGAFMDRDHIFRDRLKVLGTHGEILPNGHMRIVFPLPYRRDFQDSSHSFKAERVSRNEIQFDCAESRMRRDIRGVTFETMGRAMAMMPAHLKILAFRYRNLQQFWAYVLPEEIVAIEFTDATNYVPYLIEPMGNSGTVEFERRPHWIQHYLNFRDFAKLDTSSASELLREVPALAKTGIQIPGYSSNLINVGEEDDGSQFLEDGYWYVANSAPTPEKTKLFRFSDIYLSAKEIGARMFREVSALQTNLYKALLTPQHPLLEHLTVFRGPEVVNELMRIPVDPKLFDD